MTRKIERIVLVLCLVAAIVSVVFLPLSGSCETLRFVFLADSRSDSYGPSPVVPENFINTPVLGAIVQQILNLSPRPAFVVFAGDMAYRGHYQDDTTSFYTFQAWKNVMAPLTAAGIPVYTTMGNHELYDTHAGAFVLANQTEFQAEFTDNPDNGPPGYERLVYSFESPGGDAFFAVLDPYYLTADNPSPALGGTIDDTQLNWLADQLAQINATHKFLFIHTPYYYVTGACPAGPSEPEPPSSADSTYTNMWALLDNNRFDLYACGHVHLYSRKTIDSSIAPNPQLDPPIQWKNDVVQLLTGTAGAVIDNGCPTVDPVLWHISQTDNTYYFSVVDIDGRQVAVNSFSGNTGAYNSFDSFTIVTTVPKLIISPDNGTIGTEFTITGSGFGAKKGKVLVGGAVSKIMQWADNSVTCRLTSLLPAGAYNVTIKPQTGGTSRSKISNGFTVKVPRIDSIDPPSGSAGDKITVDGFFFGKTKGTVTLGGKNCKVSEWTMDQATGESQLQFVVPKGLSSGDKKLKVTNFIGSAKASFEVK